MKNFLKWIPKSLSDAKLALNLELDTGFVGLLFGFPPNSVFKQSIYTAFEEINKKVNNINELLRI